MNFTLKKEEKLKSRKAIENLFSDGKSFSQYPLRIVYRKSTSEHHQLAVSVAKKKFKHAVDRNLLKRRLREAYRLNKSILDNQNDRFDFIFIYLSKDKKSFLEIEEAMKIILQKLVSVSNSIEDLSPSKK